MEPVPPELLTSVRFSICPGRHFALDQALLIVASIMLTHWTSHGDARNPIDLISKATGVFFSYVPSTSYNSAYRLFLQGSEIVMGRTGRFALESELADERLKKLRHNYPPWSRATSDQERAIVTLPFFLVGNISRFFLKTSSDQVLRTHSSMGTLKLSLTASPEPSLRVKFRQNPCRRKKLLCEVKPVRGHLRRSES